VWTHRSGDDQGDGEVDVLSALVMVAAAGSLLRMEHLCLAVPPGHVMERRRGPDFALFYVRTGDMSPDTGSLAVYLGNHPTSFTPGEGVQARPFPLGRAKGKWLTWENKASDGSRDYHAEATFKRPFRAEPAYSEYLHLFVVAESESRRSELQGLAGGLHLAASNPLCPEPEPLKPGEAPF
jgi:hypothetical protein